MSDGGIQPVHVFVTLISAGTVVIGFLWHIAKSLADMNFKMNLLWEDYKKRFKMTGDR